MRRIATLASAGALAFLVAAAPPSFQGNSSQGVPGRNAAGRSRRPVEWGLLSPVRVAVDSQGTGEVIVADHLAERVLIYDGQTFVKKDSIAVSGKPLSVGVLGEVLLIGNETAQQVQVFDRSGAMKGILGGAALRVQLPRDLEVDVQAQRVFVLDGAAKEVKVVDVSQPGGQPTGTIGAPGSSLSDLQRPIGLAIDPAAQEIYVSDYGSLSSSLPPRVIVFGYDGTHRDTISGAGGPTGHFFDRPQGLALGTQPGHVFVVDAWRGEVVVMDRATNTQVGVLGAYGSEYGELLLPLDAVVTASGGLLVVSNRNQRIEVFPKGGSK